MGVTLVSTILPNGGSIQTSALSSILVPMSTSTAALTTPIQAIVSPINSLYVFTDNSSSDLNTSLNIFDNSIYRVFSMQNLLKTIIYPDRIKSEVDQFIKVATALTNGDIVDNNFLVFNEYLGSLGV